MDSRYSNTDLAGIKVEPSAVDWQRRGRDLLDVLSQSFQAWAALEREKTRKEAQAELARIRGQQLEILSNMVGSLVPLIAIGIIGACVVKALAR